MKPKQDQTNRPRKTSDVIWTQHLAWLDVTGQEARHNRSRDDKYPRERGRRTSY